MILRPVLRRNDAVLLQDGSQPLDLALLIVRFLRRERPRPVAFDQFARSRFVCTGRAGPIEATDDPAAAPLDRQPIPKPIVLDMIARGENHCPDPHIAFATRPSADSPTILIGRIKIPQTSCREYGCGRG